MRPTAMPCENERRPDRFAATRSLFGEYMSIPFFSILCPSYNHSKYIGRLIDSALGQSYKDFELIIVDDCSTDETETVVRGYSESRINFYRNKRNYGINYNLQTAFEKSRGNYVIFIGSDDEFAPDYFSRLKEAIETTGKKIFYTDYLIIDENSKPWKKQPEYANKRFGGRVAALRYMFFSGNPFSSPGMAVERGLFESILPLAPLVVQHQDFYIHANLLFKAEYELLDFKGVHYRQFKGGNISRYSRVVDARMREENPFVWDVFLRQKDFSFLSEIFKKEIKSSFDVCFLALESDNAELQGWGYTKLLESCCDPKTYERLCEERDLSYKDFLGMAKGLKKYTNWHYLRNFLRNIKCFGLFN